MEIDLACLVNNLAVCNKHKVSPIKPQSLREKDVCYHSNSFYACQNRVVHSCVPVVLLAAIATAFLRVNPDVICHSLSNNLKVMAKVTNYTRTRIELLHKQGLRPAEIFRLLKTEGLAVSLASIVCIIKKLKTAGSVVNLPRSGWPTKISDEAKHFIDRQMRKDDEMTSCRIKIDVGSSTVRRVRKQL